VEWVYCLAKAGREMEIGEQGLLMVVVVAG